MKWLLFNKSGSELCSQTVYSKPLMWHHIFMIDGLNAFLSFFHKLWRMLKPQICGAVLEQIIRGHWKTSTTVCKKYSIYRNNNLAVEHSEFGTKGFIYYNILTNVVLVSRAIDNDRHPLSRRRMIDFSIYENGCRSARFEAIFLRY